MKLMCIPIIESRYANFENAINQLTDTKKSKRIKKAIKQNLEQFSRRNECFIFCLDDLKKVFNN